MTPEKTLSWYQEQCASLARYMSDKVPNTNAIEAIVTVLSLDAGRRASDALSHVQAPAGYMRPEDLGQASFWVHHSSNAYYRNPVYTSPTPEQVVTEAMVDAVVPYINGSLPLDERRQYARAALVAALLLVNSPVSCN